MNTKPTDDYLLCLLPHLSVLLMGVAYNEDWKRAKKLENTEDDEAEDRV